MCLVVVDCDVQCLGEGGLWMQQLWGCGAERSRCVCVCVCGEGGFSVCVCLEQSKNMKVENEFY